MLERFQVSSTQFTGEVPKYLCANKVFIGLIVFKNKLTGALPHFLGDCSSLEVVRAYDNKFSGKIPDGLWTSTNLTSLMLSNNLFSGELPNELGSRLSLLELTNNQFSGPIPTGVSSWNGLTVFRASNNLLSGVIPQELTVPPLLTTVSLDGNRFSGYLPSMIVSWKLLTTLNLSRNQLSGEIPASFGLLPDLLYLDLSENGFSGQIPLEIGNLRLSSLNLSSNRLIGRIPSEFENGAFDRSFLNNLGLCSNIPSARLSNCQIETTKSNKLSSQFIDVVSSIAAVAFLAAFLYTIYVCRSYRNRKKVSDSTWKLTSFQRRVPTNRSGEYAAVKKIWDNVKFDQKLEKEFISEVSILGTIRHSNIVKLLCCISGENTKLLVYEYMENHSLDRWLHGKKRQLSISSSSVRHMVLDWPKRLQIAI
ncbi:hypothetical protein ACP275_05G091400 [Erythranthe tilingii]